MKIKLNELRKIMVDVISSNYYSRDEAQKIVEVLMYAEIAGKNSQGVVKLLGSEPAQNVKPKYPPKIIKETGLSALIDGGGAVGTLIGQIAVKKVIEIAKRKGFGIVGTNNTFSSSGVLGFYASKIAQNDLIGFVAAGSPRAQLHYGGIDSVYGTNPLAFGFPTLNQPIVFDMATSAITFYGLIRAKILGQKLPEGIAVDKNGNPTVDPAKAMEGAILPFDRSYKGSGLAMVVEVLTGPLTGAQYCFLEGDWGNLFVAISPNLLVGTSQFKKHASALIKKVKSSRTKPGRTIHIPGFDSYEKLKETFKKDEVEIEEKLIKELKGNLRK